MRTTLAVREELIEEVKALSGVKLPVLPHGASSQLQRNPPKHIRLRPVNTGLRRDTLFAFIPVLPEGAFCKGGQKQKRTR